MCRAEIQKCGLFSKIQVKQAWTSHRVTLLNEMNSVAGDTENRSLLNEATAEHESIKSTVTSICKEYQHGVRRHWSEFQQEVQVQVQQVASEEEITSWRQVVSVSSLRITRAESATSKSGASEILIRNSAFVTSA